MISKNSQTTDAPTARELIASLSDRIVRLEEEKKSIADDIKDAYAEAKSLGLDAKALKVVVKRKMESASDAAKRKETEALSEIYLASLGMLDGTPLGDSARDRMEQPPAPAEDDRDDRGASGASEDPAPPPARGVFTDEEMHAARARGAEDATAGKRIIDNPFVAGDPRRAAWDEGHCQAKGSDGMDIPDSWRRASKPKGGSAAGEGGQ